MASKKPQKKLIRFMIKPQYYQFLGLVVNKDTTKINVEDEIDGMKIKEKSTVTIELKEGTRLIWNEQKGYVLPEYDVVSVAEVKNDLECIEDIVGADYKDDNHKFNKEELGENI